MAALSRQNFAFADSLLTPWLGRFRAPKLDEKGLYLFVRSTALLGDLSVVLGTPMPAQARSSPSSTSPAALPTRPVPRRRHRDVREAGDRRPQLRNPRRRPPALPPRPGIARLWVGTALSKDGQHDYATRVMQAATRDFEGLTEPDDWSVAHQKLALAVAAPTTSPRPCTSSTSPATAGTTESPLQRVRLDIAHGHMLLSDTATREDGHLVLDQAAQVAAQYGLVHQLRSIEGIKAKSEGPTCPRQR